MIISKKLILVVLAILLILTFPINKNAITVAFPVDITNYTTTIETNFRPSLGPSRVSFEHLPKYVQNEIKCLAQNIYFEARSEPVEGQIAVAHVTLNRTESPMFPQSICEVVRQTRNNVCQFSWWCDRKLRNVAINNQFPNIDLYNQIKQLAINVVLTRHSRDDITKGALFYHANYVHRNRLGSMRLVHTTTIGQHVFYRM